MKYEDLTVFDKDLIRSGALELLSTTAVCSRLEALSKSVLSCLHACGYDLIIPKDFIQNIMFSLSKKPHLSSDEVIEAIFLEMQPLGLVLTKSEREPTWSRPKKSWYTEYNNPRKPWTF